MRSGAILSSGSAGATNAKQPAMDLRRQAERPSRAGKFRIGRNAGSGGETRQAEPGCRVPTYRAALERGAVMPGWGLGEVVKSKSGYPHGRFCGDGFLQPPRTSRSRIGPLAQSRQPERPVDTLTDWRMCRPHWLHICLKQSRQADGAHVNRLPQDSPTPISAEALR